MILLEKLQQVKETITQLAVWRTIIISKNIIRFKYTDLSKQQAFDANSKAIQQINFTGNLE